MSFHNIHYRCKMCGRAGVAKAALECDPAQIDIFAKCLCCNTCADAREKWQKAETVIYNACHFLLNADQMKNSDAIRSKSILVLRAATLKFAEAVCAQQRVQTVWEQDFADLFVRTPAKAWQAMQMYRTNIQAIARDQEPALFVPKG